MHIQGNTSYKNKDENNNKDRYSMGGVSDSNYDSNVQAGQDSNKVHVRHHNGYNMGNRQVDNQYSSNNNNNNVSNTNNNDNSSININSSSGSGLIRFGSIKKNKSITQLNTNTNTIVRNIQPTQHNKLHRNNSNTNNINTNNNINSNSNTKLINDNKFGLIVNIQPSAAYSINNQTHSYLNKEESSIGMGMGIASQQIIANNNNVDSSSAGGGKQFVRSNQIYNSNNNNNNKGSSNNKHINNTNNTNSNTNTNSNSNNINNRVQHQLLARSKQNAHSGKHKINKQYQQVQSYQQYQPQQNNTIQLNRRYSYNSNTNNNNNNNNRQVQPKQQYKQKQQQQLDRYFNNQSNMQSEYNCLQGQEIQITTKTNNNNNNNNIGDNNNNNNIMRIKNKNKCPSNKRNNIEYQPRDDGQQLFIQLGELQTLNHQYIYGYDDQPNPYNNNNKHNNNHKNHNHNNNNNKDQRYKQPHFQTLPIKTKRPLQRQSTKYGPGGIQTLEFNPEQQKIIITDSKQSEANHLPNNNTNAFCQDFEIPQPQPIPTPDNTPEELVDIAKVNFSKFGCVIDDQTVISVKKYKNCVHFSIGAESNILWHYEGGKFYYGGWKMLGNGEGEKYGEGIQYVPGKYKFKGYFAQGKRAGFGVLINFDGSAYVGQWENAMKHGQGKQLDNQGIIYQGEWKQGKKSGYGKLFNNGKLQFEGVFAKGLKNGYGKQYFENGDTYDGNYLNHKFDGKGSYYWKSGAVYNGEFKHGKRNGYGVWKSNGKKYDIYEGYYTDDKKHGKGVYRWPNGAVYDGWFKQDLKHGQGSITYQNGKTMRLIWIKGAVQKKADTAREQDIPIYHTQHALTQRKTKESIPKNNFAIQNKQASRSTQNLMSARSNSTTSNSQKFPTGIVFHTQSMKKLGKPEQSKYLSQNNRQTKKIQLNSDVNTFDSLPSKYWNKNYIINQERIKQAHASKRPTLPKDRPYTGIQASSNINMDM